MPSNQFYQATGNPVSLSRGTSSLARNEYLAIQAGFDGVAAQLGASGVTPPVVVGTNTGIVNAYNLTPTIPLVSYATNLIVMFVPTVTNTLASTLNVSALGAIPIVSVSGAALVVGDLVSGMAYMAEYNGASFQLMAITKNYADLAIAAAVAAEATLRVSGDATTAANAASALATETAARIAADALLVPLTGLKGMFGSRGLTGITATVTTYNLVADTVVLKNSSNQFAVVSAAAPPNCDITVAGPTANGRDQAGAFSASSWVYIYFIWNGATLSTLASATPPLTGPTLPAGYTYWCFATALRLDGSVHFLTQSTKGNKVYYTPQVLIVSSALTTEQTVATGGFSPPNAASHLLLVDTTVTASGVSQGSNQVSVRFITGSNFFFGSANAGISNSGESSVAAEVPNVGNIYYLNAPTGSPVAASVNIYSMGYTIPNGAA